MWGGGFWGTHREEQWRRRKEKEYERESQIRREEENVRQRNQQAFQEDLQAKDNVLKLTQSMLSVSRGREETDNSSENVTFPAAKRPRAEEEAGWKPPPADNKDAIQENLLSLSYAMYDTLFGCESFNPRSFCDFLIQSGARSVAEEIGLAAIEKTQGSADTVRYVLYDMVPQSDDKVALVQQVKEALEDNLRATYMSRGIKDEGKEVFLIWQTKHGNKEDAFQLALQITDETLRVKTCLPLLEGKSCRRQQLKEAAPHICSPNILEVFADTEWPDFLASVSMPDQGTIRGMWNPGWQALLQYATSMSPVAGNRVGTNIIEKFIRSKSRFLLARSGLPGPSSISTESAAITQIAQRRRDGTSEMKEFLSGISGALSNEEVQRNLQTLSIDWTKILCPIVKDLTTLESSSSSCTTNHRDILVAYKCTKCRECFGPTAKAIGLLVGVRQHPVTSNHSGFQSIGTNGDARMVLQSMMYSAAADAVLSDLSPESQNGLRASNLQYIRTYLPAGGASPQANAK